MTDKEVEEDIKRYPFVIDFRGCSRGVKFDASRGHYYVDGHEEDKTEFWHQASLRMRRRANE